VHVSKSNQRSLGSAYRVTAQSLSCNGTFLMILPPSSEEVLIYSQVDKTFANTPLLGA